MSGRFDVLPDAMQILGARSVAVYSLATGSRVWSVAESRRPDDRDAVAATTGMVAAAQRLVALADPGSSLDEILAMDGSWFHVLYLLGSQESGPQVAHMLLDRHVANLAQARREFWSLVEAVQSTGRAPEPSNQRVQVAPVESEKTSRSLADPVAAHVTKNAGLPRRRAVAPSGPAALPEDTAVGGRLQWADQFAGPFVTDEPTLRRLLESLRRL